MTNTSDNEMIASAINRVAEAIEDQNIALRLANDMYLRANFMGVNKLHGKALDNFLRALDPTGKGGIL